LPGQALSEKAQAFVAEDRDLLLPGDSQSQVLVKRVVDSPLGQVVQMEQRFAGLPVHGKSLVISFDEAKRLRTVVCGLAPLSTQAVHGALLPAAAAVELVRRAFETTGRLRGEPQIETVWLSGEEWIKAHLITLPGAEPFGDFTFVVVGAQGRIAWVFPRSFSVVGYAYPSNPVVDAAVEEVELPYLSSTEHLSGEHVEVFNCTGSSAGTCGAKQQLASPDENGDYLIEPTGANDPNLADDQFVEVQAYYAINRIHDYFIGIGATPSLLGVGVNYPMPAAAGPNAYYSPSEQGFDGPAIMMGQWQTIDLAVDNDVIFHEYGHHVFGEVSSAGMFSMDQYGPVFYGLAFNEATADYFSCSALDDPFLGEYFASRLPNYMPEGYLRTVENELTCPAGLYGEGHDDGMVWSGFLWAVRELLGAEIADPLYLDVIAHFPGEIDFPSATAVFLDRAALTLDAGTVEEIRELANARGIEDCTRFIPITDQGHTGFVYGQNMLQGMPISLAFIPGELHYLLDLPGGAQALDLQLSSSADTAFLVRADQPVEQTINTDGLSATYDFLLEDGGVFDLTAGSGLFEAGHRYYFQPINREFDNSEYTLSGQASCPAGTEAQVWQDDLVCAPVCEASHEIAWNGETWVCFCPDGELEVGWEGEVVCAPICADGLQIEREGDEWICVESSEGCGCATSKAADGLSLFGLFLLGLSLRRTNRRA